MKRMWFQDYHQIWLVILIEIIYLKKIKDGAYVINLDEYSDTRTQWIALFLLNNSVTYFYSFGVEHIPKEIEKCINWFTILC